MKFASHTEAQRFMKLFEAATRILCGDTYEWNARLQQYGKTYPGREWFTREHLKYRLHPAVYSMFHKLYRPHDWQQLLLEWPHKSETDPNRLAYTRDERSGEADRQVVTTIGKYLTRHFPDAPSDLIRDIVAEHTYGGSIFLTNNPEVMVKAVINGPASCMSKDFSLLCDDGQYRHPYAVYDPDLGWAMAVRSDPNEGIMGRCLVWRGDHNGDADYKCFVRSYKRERNERSHSGADEAIELWLKSQGYEKVGYWPDGLELAQYQLRSGGWLMPYIDGGTQEVDVTSRGIIITDGGEMKADNTDGRADIASDTCPDCGRRYNSEDEGIWVGVHEDEHVCGNCEDDYTYVTGRRGNQYYVPNNDAVCVDDEYYHDAYLSDNSIVELANGDYTHSDNAIYIDSEDAYYHCDDEDICYAEDSRQYEMKHNCWQCEASYNWYTEDEESVEIDGLLFHPDHAPEQETNDE
jgi:hypothetical protein